ncbi:DMT family transporter [Donghicola mangrovi]|uniref:DMT family transporter n=1 Tax=Donghicola mangrovi TaxID=2729614 RepID=A0A850Q5X0_9RHOB|nr:DMT family transporter [Donghicola mangrovi]NVO24353.1 DMT family transporter [Donghicola mangrovi]
MKKPIDSRVIGVMVILCMIWGLQQTSMKVVAGSVDPLMQIGVRSGIAAVLVWGFSRLWRRDNWHRGIFLGPGLLAGLLFASEFLLVAEGLRFTTASHISVFLYTAPIFAAIGLHIAQPDERLSVVQWVGVTVAFGGVAAIFLLPELGAASSVTRGMVIGDLLGLAAGLCWGLTTVVIRTTRVADAPPTQTLIAQLSVAAMMALGVCFVTGRAGITPTPMVLASLSFQTLIVCSISFLVWFGLLQVYRSSRLGVLSFMTPVFGVAFGALLLGEPITPEFLLGGVMVLIGMTIVQAQEWFLSRKPAPAPCS